MNYLDIDVLRSLGAEPKWFGLGFIQMKISDSRRLHFYSEHHTSQMPEEEIHNHRYRFTSVILKGSLENQLYSVKENPSGDYVRVDVSCDPANPIESTPVSVEVERISTTKMPKGASYSVLADVYHRVRAVENTVTHLHRGRVEKQFAQVVRPSASEMMCPFETTMTTDQCWEIIRDVLGTQGYHIDDIPKGELGQATKILEEVLEFMDAHKQGVAIMELVELSDLVGAVEAFLKEKHPSISFHDVREMQRVTERAFRVGARK